MSKNSSEYDANLALYLQEIAKIPLLTPEDEKHLARTIRTNELTVWVKLLSVNALLPEIWELAHSLRPDRVQDFPELPEVVSLSANDFLDKKSRAVLATSIQSLDEDQSILSTSLDRFRKLVYGEHLPAQLQCDEEELLALERARGTARRARERFVRSNLRLTVSIARRYRNRDLPLIDLVQEGNLGLIKAVHRFDQARGFRFSRTHIGGSAKQSNVRSSIGAVLSDYQCTSSNSGVYSRKHSSSSLANQEKSPRWRSSLS